MKKRDRARRLPLILFLLLLPSCRISYVLQQAAGQWKIGLSSKPIEVAMVEPGALTPEEKEKVLYILEVAAFGEELGLNRRGNYKTYFETDGLPISYSLFACSKTSFDPVVWSFPIAGEIPYLGFFDKAAALEEEASLKESGYDTLLGEVWAYSTLGWFQDPILSTMLEDHEIQLARYLLHEMTHTTIYRPGESSFNESLADFIGNRGAFSFLEAKFGVGSEEVARLRHVLYAEEVFESWLAGLEDELRRLYKAELSDAEKLERREEVFSKNLRRLRELSGQMPGDPFRSMAEVDWNNARVLSLRTYRTGGDLLERFYWDSGGQIRRFLRFLKEIPPGRDAFEHLKGEIEKRGW